MSKKNWVLKIFKRNINNTFLKNTLKELLSIKNNNTELDTKIENNLFQMQMGDIKNVTKENFIVYEDIQKNLEESEKLLNNVHEKLKITKATVSNLNIKIENIDNIAEKSKINNLNNNLSFHKDNNIMLEGSKKNQMDINLNNEYLENTALNIKKSIFDISWLQPFLDFMHNHSTVVLTIGSGLIMGGMWYMNNVGIINIGSLLSRLGIQIFSSNPEMLSQSVAAPSAYSTPLVVDTETEARIARLESSSFFRQLGKKMLSLLDVLIERLKDKRQKYK